MENLKLILSAPLTQVLVGAGIAAIVSFVTSWQSQRLQRTNLEVSYLSQLAERLTELLKLFEPVKLSGDDAAKLNSNVKTYNQVYEEIILIYFRHEALIPKEYRTSVRQSYIRAEMAYALLTTEDSDGRLAEHSRLMAAERGVDASDIPSMDKNGKRLVLIEFCMVYREALINFLDLIHDNILQALGKRWR